jgi:hypothetical protein
VPQTSVQDHYASAGRRHHEDAVYLHDDGRLPNADYHYGFAVECALKSLLLRYTGATMNPIRPGGLPTKRPWIRGADGKAKAFSHLPELWDDVALLLHGRSGSLLSGVLTGSAPFSTWSVDDRYRDGSAVSEADVNGHRAVAQQILSLHQQALLAGVLQ